MKNHFFKLFYQSIQSKTMLWVLLLTISSYSAFNVCQFNFGRGWVDNANLTGMDFVSIYAGDQGWQQYWHGAMVNEAAQANVAPLFYGYITAFMARENAGLHDCDVGEPSLCTQGANYIRNNWNSILSLYATYAQNTKNIIGANATSIWLIEPDLYQYSEMGAQQRDAWKHDGGQQGGGLSNDSISLFFNAIANTIRTHLPNAVIGLDISPWIENPAAWYSSFDKSNIDVGFTSGGRTEAANTKIRSENNMTWAQARSYIGKPIMADCGYGVGGGKTGHQAAWDSESNIRARYTDGVISINQFDARSDWNTSVLSSLRNSISDLNQCPSSSSTQTSSSSQEVSSSSSISSSSQEVSSSSSISSSSQEVSSSSVVSSSDQVSSSAISQGDCIAFENGSADSYSGKCFNAGLSNMQAGACYALNSERGNQSGWINSDASQEYWWVQVNCSGAISSSSSIVSSSVQASSSSEESNVVFSPNPSHRHQVTIFTNSQKYMYPVESHAFLTIANAKGNTLYTVPVSSSYEFSLQSYPKGVYFITIQQKGAINSFSIVQ
jgi:hypothetical protein